MPRLYHREGAGRPARVRWALEEAGAPYDFIVMDSETGRGEDTRDAIRSAGAGARRPTTAPCSSGCALLHIADLYPEAGLIPPTGTARARRGLRWDLFFAMTELEAAMLRGSSPAAARMPKSEGRGAS